MYGDWLDVWSEQLRLKDLEFMGHLGSVIILHIVSGEEGEEIKLISIVEPVKLW